MLFMLHCDIEPKHRDENIQRVQDVRIGQPPGVTILGAWMSATQLEGWVVFDAPDGESVAKLFRTWTNLNVNHVTPILDVEDMLKVVNAER